MELVHLDPKIIEWPTIRVTAYYGEGQEELLKKNLAVMEQQQPIVVIRVDGKFVGVDGRHRCLFAIERSAPSVPCVVQEGTDQDVALSNLVLNNLRGRTKASEMVEVIAELNRLGVSNGNIGKHTGHGKAWVDQHIRVSQATAPVREFLDMELITLGHADELAKVQDRALQESLCHQLLQHRWSTKELREHINAAVHPGEDGAPAARRGRGPAVVETSCGFCHHEYEPAKLAPMVVCAECAANFQQHLHLAGSGPTDDELERTGPEYFDPTNFDPAEAGEEYKALDRQDSNGHD